MLVKSVSWKYNIIYETQKILRKKHTSIYNNMLKDEDYRLTKD